MGEGFGWCFIGCGGLANRVARQITETGRHRIVSVYARGAEDRERFGRGFGALAAGTAREAMTAPGVDGVYVVTPHRSHYAYARQALELGKPVLCEKPFTISAWQTEELFRLAREKKLYAAEAMWTWFAPVANGVRDWLERGLFGADLRAEGVYRMNAANCARRLFDPEEGGGALLDIGVYPITYLYRLFGMPAQIRCAGSVSDGIDWEEDVALTFPTAGTFRAFASILGGRDDCRFSLEGTGARVEIRDFYGADRAELLLTGGGRERVEGDGSYVREFDAVAQEIRAGRTESRFVPWQATLDVMRILDECRRQMGLVYPFET